MKTVLVKQRKEYDCALAALSMASGKPYDVLFDAEFCSKIDVAKTCTGDNLDEAYKRAGFIKNENMWVMYTSGINPQMLKQMLRGRRALIQVPSLNYAGVEHFIYWDGQQLYDPSNKQAYQFMQSVFPTYVTLFDETQTPDLSKMVDRFLGWKLPEGFSPDGGITFKPTDFAGHRSCPVGTNLLSSDQARAMLEYVLG